MKTEMYTPPGGLILAIDTHTPERALRRLVMRTTGPEERRHVELERIEIDGKDQCWLTRTKFNEERQISLEQSLAWYRDTFHQTENGIAFLEYHPRTIMEWLRLFQIALHKIGGGLC